MQINVLLCDDEAIQRAAMRVALTHLTGLPLEIASVREARHGREALAMIAESPPHVVFLDLRMPVLGGLETATIIRRQYPKVEIIILTAYDEFHFAQEALKLGVKDYLLKPATDGEIAQVLTKVMQELLIRSEDAHWLASLQQKVEEAKPYIQLEYIDDLLGLARLDKTAIDEKRSFLGLARHPELVMLLELDDFARVAKAESEMERQARKEEVWTIIWQQASGYAPLLARMGGDRFCLLFPAPEQGMTEQECGTWAITLAERLRRTINRSTGLKVTVGIGRRYDDPRELQHSFREAQLAVSYKFILGGNHTIHIDDVEFIQAASNDNLQHLEDELQMSLRLGDNKVFSAKLKQFIDQLCCTGLESLDSARWSFLQLFVALARAANTGGAAAGDLAACNLRYMRLLYDAATLAELRDTMFAAGEELIDLVSQVRNLRHYKLVERAKRHMAEHFAESVLLDDVASVVYLSPFYFSHVFKEQTGMTFIEYLTYLRVNEAKRLLRETLLPVGSIAAQVGYNDVNYFSRVFKKEVGQTPSQYRDSTPL